MFDENYEKDPEPTEVPSEGDHRTLSEKKPDRTSEPSKGDKVTNND